MNNEQRARFKELLNDEALNAWFDKRLGKRIGQLIGRNVLKKGESP